MQTLNVALGERAYPIHIGRGLLGRADLILPHLKTQRVAIVTNEVVGPLYLERLRAGLEDAGVRTAAVVLPDGEAHKDWETLARIFDMLLAERCERSTTLVALGGGVVGDMGGFAAACYQRGMPFIQVPTTLLSQVDSSVGGKTAINHPLGKNMIGAFHQPVAVLSDTAALATLPPREYACGLAEIVKHALIFDAGHLAELERDADALMAREPAVLARVIRRSCELKAAVVAQDERETLGLRALLNLGHTFGHAIETEMGYGVWLHGEAVAAGCALAARLSAEQGTLSEADVLRIERLFQRFDLPVRPPEVPAERLVEHMTRDKKNEGGRVTLVLLEAIGKARLDRSFTADALAAFIRRVQACPATA